MKILKFAAIDIGSNAIRLLIMNVIEKDGHSYFRKSSIQRVPIRLGMDTFIDHIISRDNEKKLIKTMKAFKHLMEVHEIITYRACATSAMREAQNGRALIEKIHKKTGILIDIITGKEEAEIILSNQTSETLDSKRHYLYVDVGGGSTELTLVFDGKSQLSASFNIGTLRILKNIAPQKEFMMLKEFLLNINSIKQNIEMIGSGGNINKLLKYSQPKSEKFLSYMELKNIYNDLNKYSYEELMIKYEMRPDRADVIIPAATIFLSIMEWARVNILHIPKIGVADGIIHQLYTKYLLTLS